MRDDLYKFPRLYLTAALAAGDMVLCDAHAHYLRHVLRHQDGDKARFFNGRDGEWLGTLRLVGKRDMAVTLEEQVRPQAPRKRRVHLYFAPLKKDRLEDLVNAAVQLGATDLHPVISDRTEVREIKDKVLQHMIEAAEQCERMDLPVLHPVVALEKALAKLDVPLFAGLERSDAAVLRDHLVPAGDVACLVGPVGGWTMAERDMLAQTKGAVPVSLGPNVLRSETAVAAFLTRLA